MGRISDDKIDREKTPPIISIEARVIIDSLIPIEADQIKKHV